MIEALQIPLAAGLLTMAADVVKCEVPDAPQIYVRPEAYPIEYNHRRSIENLTNRGSDTISPYPRHAVTKTGGLTESQIEFQMNMQFQHQTYPGYGVGCVYFDRVDVTIILDPVIYIASDYSPYSCHYKEVLVHEKKHVRVDKEIINKYARKIGEALRLSINNAPGRGPYPVERLETIQSDMQAYVASVVKTQQSLLEEERFRAQQNVDTLEEYERIRQLCDD